MRIDLSRLICVNSPLDFRPQVWYVVLLEGGESFEATEEEHQPKSFKSGCFSLREAAAFPSSELNSYCAEPWLL